MNVIIHRQPPESPQYARGASLELVLRTRIKYLEAQADYNDSIAKSIRLEASQLKEMLAVHESVNKTVPQTDELPRTATEDA